MIEFTVFGVAQPRGSKSPWVPKRADGSPVTKNGRIVVATMDSNKRSRSWMNDVRAAAAEAYRGELLTGAVRLSVAFYLPRPKGHFRQGKHAGKLRETAPAWHTQKPDCDKLSRGVQDALIGLLYRDDSQVVQLVVAKNWTDAQAHTLVRVEQINDPTLFRKER